MAFEWDDEKAAENLAKHGIPFEYASRVFDDLYRIEEEDPDFLVVTDSVEGLKWG